MIELRRRYSGSKGSGSPSFSRLPAGYQEVEYLENTSGAYLILSIKPQIGDAIKVKFRDALKNNNTSVCAIIGSERFGFGIDGSYKIYGNSANQFTSLVYNGKINTVLYEWKESAFAITVLGDDLTKLGSFEYPRSSTYTEININLPIFTAYYNGYNSSFSMAGNVYIYEYYRDGELFANLVPCYRISDRVAGMYDIVNDVFYTNAGTGEFSYGQDVHYNIPPEYQQVEYLESTGTQYMVVNFDSQYHSSGIYHAIGEHMTFGVYNDYGSNSLQLYDYGNDSASIRVGIAVSTIISPSPNYIQMDTGTGKIIYDDNIIQIDGALPPDFHFLQGIPLFGRFNTLNIDPKPSVFKRFYVFSKNRIILDLIPCYRKSDNVAGMYDLVSGEFYTNAGTGKFDVGPVVIG